MITPEIISYIKAERIKSTPDSVIKSNLTSNGWTEKDVREAMAASSAAVDLSGVPQPVISTTAIKEYRNKVTWMTFFVLTGIDILIILMMKASYGTYGLFGISIPAIVGRLLIIYLISAFSGGGATLEDKTSKAVSKSVAKVIGTIIVVIVVAVGIFFAGCLFLISTSGH